MDTMEAKLDIIVGISYFTPGNRVVGVAFPYDNDPTGAQKWADEVGRTGRPATVIPVNGSDVYDKVVTLRQRWSDWAQKEGIDLTITDGIRQVCSKF